MVNEDRLTTQRLETISTISWLLMDFCWSSEYMILSWIFSFIALTFAILAFFSYDGTSKGERYLLGASCTWVMMNSVWLWGDTLKIGLFLVLAKIFFIATAILIVVSFMVSKREGVDVDLKRLKIK